MEQILHSVAGILLKSIPTAVLLLFLYFYLKFMLFGPLQGVLTRRDELTAGTRTAADQSLKAAERKIQEYEAKLREARAEVYREQEEKRQQWLADQTGQLTQARERTGLAVQKAKEEMAAEVAAARQSLEGSAGALADQIVRSVLARKAG